MSDDRDTRIRDLQEEVARLRRLLDQEGATSTLRHQVRNALGLMRSILRRSAQTSPSVDAYAAHLEGRFDALLRVQATLIAGADQGVDLHTLIGNELLAHVIHEGKNASLEGPQLRIEPRYAEVLALAFHELVTNAVKFGAMTVPEGHIRIGWSVFGDDPPVLHLTWVETGLKDLAPSPPFRGFGIDAIEGMLQYQFGAQNTLEFRPEGLHCVINLPLKTQPRRG